MNEQNLVFMIKKLPLLSWLFYIAFILLKTSRSLISTRLFWSRYFMKALFFFFFKDKNTLLHFHAIVFSSDTHSFCPRFKTNNRSHQCVNNPLPLVINFLQASLVDHHNCQVRLVMLFYMKSMRKLRCGKIGNHVSNWSFQTQCYFHCFPNTKAPWT